jgi:hypothetical protein
MAEPQTPSEGTTAPPGAITVELTPPGPGSGETAGDAATAGLAVGATVVAAQANATVENLEQVVEETADAVKEYQEWQTQMARQLLETQESTAANFQTLQSLQTAMVGMGEMLTQIMTHVTPQQKSSANVEGLPAQASEVPTSNQTESSETQPQKPEPKKHHWI